MPQMMPMMWFFLYFYILFLLGFFFVWIVYDHVVVFVSDNYILGSVDYFLLW